MSQAIIAFARWVYAVVRAANAFLVIFILFFPAFMLLMRRRLYTPISIFFTLFPVNSDCSVKRNITLLLFEVFYFKLMPCSNLVKNNEKCFLIKLTNICKICSINIFARKAVFLRFYKVLP